MPFIGLIYIAIAIFFAVHALRSGRNMVWLFILFLFPFLGSVVYFLVEYLPEMRHSSVGRRSARVVKSLVDPNRALREAELAFDRTPTADNRHRLAEALLARGDAEAAIEHFQACASGPYADDAKFLRGLARAQLGAGRHAAAVATLDRLFAAHPAESRAEPALWYAQALAEVDEARALAAFERASTTFDTTETLAAYGLYLARLGRDAQARPLLERVVHNGRVGTASSRDLNRAWIDQARAALKELDARAA